MTTASKALPVAFAAGGRRLRALFGGYFADEQETIGDEVTGVVGQGGASVVRAVPQRGGGARARWLVCSELVFGDALLCVWQQGGGGSPFESKCTCAACKVLCWIRWS
jgi:hypothetical protein